MSDTQWERFGQNAGLLAELYAMYQQDPALVGNEWAAFFESLHGKANGASNGIAYALSNGHAAHRETVVAGDAAVLRLIDAYRRYGHFSARINPLTQVVQMLPHPEELSPSQYGVEGTGRFSVTIGNSSYTDVSSVLLKLGKVYGGSVGFEFMHLPSREQREWLAQKIESSFPDSVTPGADRQRRILEQLAAGELFESELHKKYVGTKRFSLEGGEVLIAMLDQLLVDAAAHRVDEVVFGMAHRGRLNVLTNILGKPLQQVFCEFEDQSAATVLGSGDVKYHLGYENTWHAPDGTGVKVRMVPNPSHLEFVNPVVEGIVRALQDAQFRADRGKVLPVLLHGDAAFAGQGVVFETINYSQLEGYKTGGTVHVVINNQIGFTTTPDEARSTAYCTDLAKGVDAPVFHVNGEDVEACLWVTQLALEYRQRFQRDVFIDLYCFRKYGHNEGDDPSFTQPLTYSEIKSKKPVYTLYAEKLVAAGACTAGDVETVVKSYRDRFAEAQGHKDSGIHGDACSIHGRLRIPTPPTGVDREKLVSIARTLITFPDGFVPHPKLLKILEKRVETVEQGGGIEWGMAEALAFGSLVMEGRQVRLSGQDCGRGTFSQRHLLLDHYEAPATFVPFTALSAANNGTFEVFNSSLSEAAVVGFEFGYSSVATKALVLWEAQFGDFGNGAQVIIDQFIAGSEAKWGQLSGVTMLLPHGYEGQGPEHSSARLERYLQLCGEGNMVVCYPSTAAQHFHLLRRQGLLEMKRPLIVMTPKSMLRMASACATTDELVTGQFQPILETDIGERGKAETVVMLTGKIYHEVLAALEKEGKPVKIVRVEQLHPFPQFEFKKALKGTKAKKFIWVQEEPENMGAWGYIQPYLTGKLELNVTYAGRDAAASTATGSPKHHAKEQAAIVSTVLDTVRK